MSDLSCYQILRPIGSGTFGKVKLARHLLTSSLVAIKVINKAAIQSKNLYSKVKKEVMILRIFKHPNIIRLYDVIESSTSFLIVMEYLPGGDLYNVIEKQRLNEDQARDYFIQILSGLEYIHSKGFAHRDLKPENLMLDNEGRVKIGDFGLSNSAKPGEFLDTQCGSPNYVAPEVISGEKYCGTEVDIWSLGIVLYALMARELPFDDSSIPRLFALIKSGCFKFQHCFSVTLKDLISRMLNKDPIARITIPQIKNHCWLKCSSTYDISMNSIQKTLELYESKDIRNKVLLDCLGYKEFKALKVAEAEGIIKKRLKAEEFSGDPSEISVAFNVLLDIEVRNRSKEKEIEGYKKKRPVFKLELKSCSEFSTAGSSIRGEYEEKTIPVNWTYGIKTEIDLKKLIGGLYEHFKQIGLFWKCGSKNTVFLLKGNGVKMQGGIFKSDDTIVMDFILKNGPVMAFFELVCQIYSFLNKFTQL